MNLPLAGPIQALKMWKKGLSCYHPSQYFGVLSRVCGALCTVSGLNHHAHIGSKVRLHRTHGLPLMGEIIGFDAGYVHIMGYTRLDGLAPGMRVELLPGRTSVHPHTTWKGRVLDAFGVPLDKKGPLTFGPEEYSLKQNPPPATERQRLGSALDLGIKALNTMTTCCQGQRMGIFAGSGVGKSVLLGQITRFSACDTVIVGLIGERGREVREFLEEQLGEEGIKRSVIVIATSDQPALVRRQAAYLTLTLAEYFRDQGEHVVCVMDSVTRIAMAQREIGLALGEPPTTKGFTPSVLSEMPYLLERAGPGIEGSGSITGFFTVLIEGDDLHDIIGDTVRGILDGHIILSRDIAQRGRYPAVDVLKSLSRTMPACQPEKFQGWVHKARTLLSTYDDVAELIRLGAYQAGSSQEVDKAIRIFPLLENFFHQAPHECVSFEDSFNQLASILMHV